MRNLFMMFVAAISFVVFSGSASATVGEEKWTVEGVRMMYRTSAPGTLITLPVSNGPFATLALCNAFIVEQNALPMGFVGGYEIFQTVKADCSPLK